MLDIKFASYINNVILCLYSLSKIVLDCLLYKSTQERLRVLNRVLQNDTISRELT